MRSQEATAQEQAPNAARSFWTLATMRSARDGKAWPALTSNARLVWLMLTIRANDHGITWPSLETLAGETGLGESTTRRALRELEASGLLVTDKNTSGRASRYQIVTPGLVAFRSPSTTGAVEEGNRSGPPGQPERAPKRASDQKSKSDHQHTRSPRGSAGALKASPTPTNPSGEGSAGVLPDDLAQLARERRGLDETALRRLIGAFGQDRTRAAAASVDRRYPGGVGLKKGFGAVLTTALREDWAAQDVTPPGAPPPAPSSAAIDAATPPASATVARVKATGELIAIQVVNGGTPGASVHDLERGGVLPVTAWPLLDWLDSATI